MTIGRPKSNRHHVGEIFRSKNYGDFQITGIKSAVSISVKFLNTGFETEAQSAHIRSGAVKDPTMPIMHGVGFFGVGRHSSKAGGKAYQTWKNMLARCYSVDYQRNNPSYIGCSVCEEWHNFQNFAEWHGSNYRKDLHLDKDMLIDENRVYSPSTCKFVTPSDNTVKAHAKGFMFRSPLGSVVSVYNLSEFCRENNLSQGHMSSVHSGGGRKQHKGWTRV